MYILKEEKNIYDVDQYTIIISILKINCHYYFVVIRDLVDGKLHSRDNSHLTLLTINIINHY